MDDASLASLWRFDPLPLRATLAAVLLYSIGTGPLLGRLTDGRFPAGKTPLLYTGIDIITLVFISTLRTLIAVAVVFARWFEGERAQARETRVLLPTARLGEVSAHE